MSEIMDHVAYLSQHIGPRPAGTEEEQQAALYITEKLQKEAGLPAVVEDFNNVSNSEAVRTLCCVVMILAAALSLLLPIVSIPCVLLTVVAAVLFVLETLGHPLLSRLLPMGVSQNVVAKHEPGYVSGAKGARRRKVVVVARYDTGKAKAEMSGSIAEMLPVLRLVILGAAVFVALFSLLRIVFFPHVSGAAAVVCNALTVIALVFVALPVVGALADKRAAYNEGANCNAAGVAVLMDVAARVGLGRGSKGGAFASEAGFNPTVHGEEAARAAGLVPEGTQLVYEAASVQSSGENQTPEARLVSAKAAVAALSGKPVSGVSEADIAKNLAQAEESFLSESLSDNEQARNEEANGSLGSPPMDEQGGIDALAEGTGAGDLPDGDVESNWASGAQAEVYNDGEALGEFSSSNVSGVGGEIPSTSVGVGTAVAGSRGGVPDWFKRAQQNAKKPSGANVPVHRSRYADALAAVSAASAEREQNFARDVEAEWGEALGRAEEAAASKEQGRSADATSAVGAEAPVEEGADALIPAQAAEGLGVPEAGSANGANGGGWDGGESNEEGAAAIPPSGRSTAGEGDGSSLDGRSVAVPFDIEDLRVRTLPDQSEVGMPAFLQDYPAASEATVAESEVAGVSEDVPPAAPQRAEDGAEATPDAGEYAPIAASTPPAEPRHRPTKRRPITLPDVGSAPAPIPTEAQKQRAPLADVESSGKTAAKKLLTMLPSIDLGKRDNSASQEATQVDGAGNSEDAASDSPKKGVAKLRRSLPSLSGSLAASQVVADDAASLDATIEDSAAGASEVGEASGRMIPVVAGATGSFAPVGEELLQNMDPDDIYVEDVDDSDYEGNVTETGAFAGPGYVEMPKSRMHRLLSKLPFGRKNREEETTTQEWLDVDESFDARSVGAARGSWESFRNEEDADPAPYGDFGEDVDDGEEVYTGQYSSDAVWDEDWQDQETRQVDDFAYESSQGEPDAFLPGEFGTRFGADDTLANLSAEEIREGLENDDFQQEEADQSDSSRRRWNGGAFSGNMMERVEEAAAGDAGEGSLGEYDQPLPEMGLFEEQGQIQSFRSSGIDTEVWFVALGAELAQNGGMRAFLAEHAQELRGAIIVELDGLGAGELSLVEREGAYRTVSAPSRMKRYAKKAMHATGTQASSVTLRLGESSASFAMKQGYQTMHLVGADGAKPAYFAQDDDVLENVDEEKLLQNADFVMELLRSI